VLTGLLVAHLVILSVIGLELCRQTFLTTYAKTRTLKPYLSTKFIRDNLYVTELRKINLNHWGFISPCNMDSTVCCFKVFLYTVWNLSLEHWRNKIVCIGIRMFKCIRNTINCMCNLDSFPLIRLHIRYVQLVMYLGIIKVHVSSRTVVLWSLIFCFNFHHYFIHCLSMCALPLIHSLNSPHHSNEH